MIAYFDPRGLDFCEGDNVHGSDVGNYRLLACIVAKNGEPLIIEFGGWQRREQYKTNRGIIKYRVADKNALYANGQHTCYIERPDSLYGPEAGTYGFNFEEELGVNPNDYHYTRADILQFLSDVSGEQYTTFVFDMDKVNEQIATIYEPVEKAIYQRQKEVRRRIEEEREEKRRDALEKLRMQMKS